MLSHGGFPQCKSLSQNPITHFLLYPNKTLISFFSSRVVEHKFFAVHGRIRTGFCVFASNSRRKSGISILEMDEFDDETEEKEEGEEDNEDEEVVIPLKNMKKWLENKPQGFGEGKVYDTTIEDKLFEEMERSRLAQLANITKLKHSPEEINFKNEQLKKEKVSGVVTNGICVRLINLPKKKNIHRDLQVAFKGVPGIINIIPAVSGNKKTREPVSKGFGFVDFKSEDEANRFVQIFSRQSITFGKIQKKINCEMINSSSPNLAYEQSIDRTDYLPSLANPSLEENLNPDFVTHNISFDSWEKTTFNEYKGAHDASAIGEDNQKNFTTFSSSMLNSGDGTVEQGIKSATSSQPSKNRMKIGEKGKKILAKRKGEKTPRLNIPGSANRLKIKEKSLLTGAFSKYGVKAVLASKGQSDQ